VPIKTRCKHRSFFFKTLEFPVPPEFIFLLFRRNVHNRPDILISAPISSKQPHQAVGIQAVGLGPPFPSVDFDAGRIDHQTFNAFAF
jgi:hypothetical protein